VIDFTGISPNAPRRRGGIVQGSRLDQWARARFDETNPLSRKRCRSLGGMIGNRTCGRETLERAEVDPERETAEAGS